MDNLFSLHSFKGVSILILFPLFARAVVDTGVNLPPLPTTTAVPMANLPPVSMIPVANLPPVSLIPVANLPPVSLMHLDFLKKLETTLMLFLGA
jgi:hypothetical protein